ncbi:MAG: GNAT family N-acetyltransferase [Anaerolineales bacterium]|nr:GNAT family N-acetyltransferase [Anaerolineales bacterium]
MAVIARSRTQSFGLRPMDPLKDLRGVANLIEEAFADDLDRSGQSALRELRWLSYMKPILWWMVVFSSDHNDFLSGFVWEEDRKIVGNITVNRTAPGSRRWLISNLAVAKNYRGRSIARGLMYTGIELVKEYNGTSVSLQVRSDNAPAKHLYDTLNFREISGTTYLRLNRIPRIERQDIPPLPKDVTLRPRRFDSIDARQSYQLASAAVPPEVQREWPLRQSRFRLDGQEQWLTNFFHKIAGVVQQCTGWWRMVIVLSLPSTFNQEFWASFIRLNSSFIPIGGVIWKSRSLAGRSTTCTAGAAPALPLNTRRITPRPFKLTRSGASRKAKRLSG